MEHKSSLGIRQLTFLGQRGEMSSHWGQRMSGNPPGGLVKLSQLYVEIHGSLDVKIVGYGDGAG